jgi:hypothetical protein
MHVDDDVPLPTIDVTQVTEAFHQHVFKPVRTDPGTDRLQPVSAKLVLKHVLCKAEDPDSSNVDCSVVVRVMV